MTPSASPLAEAVWDRRPQTATPIIDAHAHSGPYSLFFIPDDSPAAMVRVMDRCGVRTALVASHLAIQLDARAGNEQVADAAEQFPGRILGHITVNPWQDPAAELERWADDRRFVSIKLHPSLHHYPLTGPRYKVVWEFAERTGCPVLTHTWEGSQTDNSAIVDTVLDRYPGVRLIAGHGGATMAGFDAMAEVAKRRPALTIELCGSNMTGRVLERLVGEVGADRIAYGSDFPFIDMRFSLGRVAFARLSEPDREAVLGGTVAKLLSWRDAGRSPAS
jgi:predicted TIM-barrel fold metal-dependent hydrolase